MESGRVPIPSPTEPGRTTVQLLVACSATLAVLQLVAATSVEVFNGGRPGWWMAIQGATVAFAAAFAGAAAGAAGAWFQRMREGAGSSTPKSLITGIGAASVVAMVFTVLCWAAIAQQALTVPVALAVLLASLIGGLAGSFRVGGAVLGGLVAVFVATLGDLVGQALTTLFVLGPAVASGDPVPTAAPLWLSTAIWTVSAVAGTTAGCWWLSRRRQYTALSHCAVIGVFPAVLVTIGNLTSALGFTLVDDPASDGAFGTSLALHGTQIGVYLAGGLVAAAGMALSLRRRNALSLRPISVVAMYVPSPNDD